MGSLVTGEVEAVSWKNKSFKLVDGDWFKLGNDVSTDIKDIKKGQSVTLDYNPSTKDGRTTNWVNLLDIEREDENGHEEPSPAPKSPPQGDLSGHSYAKPDPRGETPPVGAHATKGEYQDKNRTITLLAIHKAIAGALINSGIESAKAIWEQVAAHEAELNKLLGK